MRKYVISRYCCLFVGLFLWLSPSAGNYVYLFAPWCCAPILSCTPCHLFKYSSVPRYKAFALSVITGLDWQVFMKSWLRSVEFIYCIYVTPGRINTFRIIDGGLELHHLGLFLFFESYFKVWFMRLLYQPAPLVTIHGRNNGFEGSWDNNYVVKPVFATCSSLVIPAFTLISLFSRQSRGALLMYTCIRGHACMHKRERACVGARSPGEGQGH